MLRLSLFLLLGTIACATAPKQQQTLPAAASPVQAHGHGSRSGPPEGTILDTTTGKTLRYEELISALSPIDHVYVGETHDDRLHHEIQLWVLKGLFYARPGQVALGMEMFQRPFQNVLDLYLSGELGEKAMIRETQYEDRWGFDFSLYRPILRFALDHQVPVIALNAPTEWVKTISKGGLEALSPEDRAQVPELDLNNKEHRKNIEEAFSQHPHGGNFERFYLIQTLWDETMADSVARFAKQYTGAQVVVLAGGGHVEQGLGIPSRVQRRVSGKYKTVIPVTVEEGQPIDEKALLAEKRGDYLWVVSGKKDKVKNPHTK
jgi:uncharacterized iron-regulated protein